MVRKNCMSPGCDGQFRNYKISYRGFDVEFDEGSYFAVVPFGSIRCATLHDMKGALDAIAGTAKGSALSGPKEPAKEQPEGKAAPQEFDVLKA